MNNKKIYLCHSGGLWHFLKCIGSIIDVALKSDRNIIIDTENTNVFSCNFSKLFEICDPIIECRQESIDECKKKYTSYSGLGNDIEKEIISDNHKFNLRDCNNEDGTYLPKNIKMGSFGEYENKILNELSDLDTIILYSGKFTNDPLIKCISRIKINECTRLVVDELYNTLPNKCIGIQYRDSDRKSDFNKCCGEIKTEIVKHDCRNIFIATDNTNIINNFKKEFPDCVFFIIII